MNGFLIGQHGDTMRSLQYLVSTALKNQGHEYWRVNVDIAGYKQQRADHLAEKAQAWVDKVKSSNEAMDLQPMNAADRRIIHKLADEAGLTTESIGEGRDRHVVLKPAAE
jgi:spoIIIJ-associated protein